MTSVSTEENAKENTMTLYLKYRDEFKDTISNFYDNIDRRVNENPGKYCATDEYRIFQTADKNIISLCQEIGINLFKIKRDNFDRIKRCKYLNYLINIKGKYNSNPLLFQMYNKFSNDTCNICMIILEKINRDILTKLTVLYNLYKGFNDFISEKNKAATSSENPKKYYDFYIQHSRNVK
ncbi:hypothetical protein MKS88_001580 [Plasmodium brasilianum]|uniref:Uncharacterized protein n=1 Tax=Plasmodium brasilianum TaxID=5824 RepID=A0ACB9YER2_PLABR|nr:hypothetical protein MKS88_001580 [Plasmodium brasilianum]